MHDIMCDVDYCAICWLCVNSEEVIKTITEEREKIGFEQTVKFVSRSTYKMPVIVRTYEVLITS